jgi:hypothetical protein
MRRDTHDGPGVRQIEQCLMDLDLLESVARIRAARLGLWLLREEKNTQQQ